MARSYAELMGLEFEAERLVRSGESRAEVSRRLGVHPQTLATWALRGGWRKKDLDMERSAEATRETLHAIRRGNQAVDAEKEARVKLRSFMEEAVRALASDDPGEVARLGRMLAQLEGTKRLAGPRGGPRVELGPDPKMGHMLSLGSGDIDRKRDPTLTEDGEVWTAELQRQINAEARAGGMRPARRKRERTDGG